MNDNIDRINPNYWDSWDDDNFKIFYPKDWIIEDQPLMPIIKFQMVVPDNFDFFASIAVEVLDVESDYTLDSQVLSLEKNLPNLIYGLDNLSIEKNTDEHLNYLNVSFDGLLEGIIFKYMQYQWRLCNKIVTLQFICEGDSVSDFSKTKELIFNTFEIK